MDLGSPTSNFCTCACPCCGSDAATWQRSVKRKVVDPPAGGGGAHGGEVAARVDMDHEVDALREALSRQQQTIQELYAELEQEQNAASSAASEAMSMILRLQREKAETQMEARQFKRFAEERMAHDQQELAELDDLLFRREQAMQALTCEIKSYKHRLASYGIGEDYVDAPEPDESADIPEPVGPTDFDLSEYEYPPLRCTVRGDYDDEDDNIVLDDKYTPSALQRIKMLESRIYELESAPGTSTHVKLMDKGLSTDFDPEIPAVDNEDDDVRDDGSARIYTIDTVHAVPIAGVSDEDKDEECISTPREKENGKVEDDENVGDDGDINKLYKRLQALEADRESMRQAIISMRTEKAQLVLLKEIAQQLCKEAPPEKRLIKKPSLLTTFSVGAVVKWVMSFLFWRKKASLSKYSFGQTKNNAGLLLLLDKSPQMNHWRRLAISRAQS